MKYTVIAKKKQNDTLTRLKMSGRIQALAARSFIHTEQCYVDKIQQFSLEQISLYANLQDAAVASNKNSHR